MQLTSLRPTADLFCALLRDALKFELQAGRMKIVKTFAKSCYSEILLSGTSPVAEGEREDGSLIDSEAVGENGQPAFHGGLGLKFKFPGDPKKCVECPFHLGFALMQTTAGFVKLLRLNYGPII
jgi:hypothetical protein